jgi:sugar phosphate isomerase/epimerase
MQFSLAHLTILSSPPPELAYIAAEAGYDFVSPRIILSGMPNETGISYDLAKDPAMYREMKKAVSDSGIRVHDIELVRISDTFDPTVLPRSLEIAAELGVRAILSSIWTTDRSLAVERFVEVCELARPYGLEISLEFVPWADVKNLRQALDLLAAAHCSNARLMVDVLHAHNSHLTPEELAVVPRELFSFIHLCDGPAEIPTTEEALIYSGREARLYVGEGGIDVAAYLHAMPNVPYSLEIPNLERVKQLGNLGHAKRCLQTAKDFLAAHPFSLPADYVAGTLQSPSGLG